jgi:hypothetical protein
MIVCYLAHRFEIDHAARRLVTTLPDGATLVATPNDDAESVARAHELGYGGDTWAMTLHRDPLHVWLMAGLLGHATSTALWWVGHPGAAGAPPSGSEQRGQEEYTVLALQRLVMTGEGRDVLYPLAICGHPIDDLAAGARAFLGPFGAEAMALPIP